MRILAVLFNLILVPGVGHIAIGRWKRGLPWLAAVMLTMPIAFVHPALVMLLVVAPRLGSAIEVGRLEHRWQPTPMQSLAVYGGGLFGAAVWFSLVQTFVVEAWKIPSGAMIPTLEIGDHVFGSKLAYEIGEPARGDVAIFVNPCEPDKDFVKRIVGLPGDTIEVRCDVLYLNGKPAPATSLKEECAYWDRREDGGPWVEEKCTTYVEKLGDKQYEIVHSPVRREKDRLRKVAGFERSYEELRGEGDFPLDILPHCPPGSADIPPVGRFEPSLMDPSAGACKPRSHYVVPDGHAFVMGDNRENASDSRLWGPVPLGNFKAKVFSIWWSSRPDEQGGVAWDRIGDVD